MKNINQNVVKQKFDEFISDFTTLEIKKLILYCQSLVPANGLLSILFDCNTISCKKRCFMNIILALIQNSMRNVYA